MNKFEILFCLLTLLSPQINARCNNIEELNEACACPQGDITFNTQAQIDAFPNDYPSCTQIIGSVVVAGSSTITNLNGLSSVTSIGGSLSILSPNLINLNGLSALVSVGDYLYLNDCHTLSNLIGLNALTSLGGGLGINGNNSMISLSGLNSLTSIGGQVTILNNPVLNSLSGLNAINTIGGELFIGGNNALITLTGLNALLSIGGTLHIENDALTSLSGLNALSTIGGDLNIYLANDLANLSGLNSLTSIGGDLFISENSSLSSLSGLDALSTIGGDVLIANNPSLSSLTGLIQLTSIGGLLLIQNNALTSLNGLDNINPATIGGLEIINSNLLSICDVQSICEYLSIPSNPATISNNATGCNTRAQVELACLPPICPNGDVIFASQAQLDNFQSDYPGCSEIQGNITIDDAINGNILNLNGLSAVTSIDGFVWVKNNSALTNLTGLNNITSIGDFLKFENNDAITNLTGISNLTSVGGFLFFQDNSSLTSISGLSGVQNVGDYLCIMNNSALTNIAGLSSITSVGGFLEILNNDALTNLGGLSGITSLGGYLKVESNTALTSLIGLDNIEHSTITNLFIENSNLLTLCEVKSICDYLAIPTNPATISGNAIGCATRAQIEAACLLLPIELVSFIGKSVGNNVVLSWQTATEKNFDFFQVDHSQDGMNFKNLGIVKGHGNSTELQPYTFIHYDSPHSVNYYRLKQVGFDGESEYSMIIIIKIDNDEINLFPNPTSGIVEVSSKNLGDGTIRLVDNIGRLVKTQALTDSNLIDIRNQPDGMYLIEILTDKQTTLRRVFKQ